MEVSTKASVALQKVRRWIGLTLVAVIIAAAAAIGGLGAKPAAALDWIEYDHDYYYSKESCDIRGKWMYENVADVWAWDCRSGPTNGKWSLWVLIESDSGCFAATEASDPRSNMAAPDRVPCP